MVKVFYILYNINKSLHFEWVCQLIDARRVRLAFILLSDRETEIEKFLKNNSIPVIRIRYGGKKDMLYALWELVRLFWKYKPDLIHCHLRDANILGLTAGILAGIRRRIYTRHHSTYHHKYFPRGVLYDRYCNILSTQVVAASLNVRKVLVEYEDLPVEKVVLIPFGIDLKSFDVPDQSRVSELRNKYGLDKKHPVIGVISRYHELKGIQYIIPAFEKLLETYPDARLVLANVTRGGFQEEIRRMLKTLKPGSFIEIEFEIDIIELYHTFDVFVHVPVDPEIEAFGQIYIEALAAGIPSVFTLSGIAKEFIKDGFNALVVDYNDSDQICKKILTLIKNPDLCKSIVHHGKSSVEKFSHQNMIQSLENLYQNVEQFD